MVKDYKNAKETDNFYMNITYKEANEALNLPADYRLSGLREVFEILKEKNMINVWLLTIKEGKQSPSRLASGQFPRIVEEYKSEKKRIAPLVKEMNITKRDVDKLNDNEKDACKDKNDLLKFCIIKKLRKKSLIPFDLATMGKEALINKIIALGGLREFAKEYGLKTERDHRDDAIDSAKILHKKIKEAEDTSHMRRRSSHKSLMQRARRGGKKFKKLAVNRSQ